MKHHSPARPSRGFTLIEMLVVITIIVILAGLVMGGMGYVQQRQAYEKAKVQLALLAKGIEEYKSEMGKYPGTLDDSPVDGKISGELFDALFYQGYKNKDLPTPPAGEATKVYVAELDPTSSKMGWVSGASIAAGMSITDPWGATYRYRKGTNSMNPGFDLWSMGKDGKTSDTAGAKDAKDDVKY